ncbi:MAG: hypothetical protein EAZ18_00125 [Oscillatoriales cyanobacterium]|nr:MAG: hypothetical protein EAZ18_00125 [Oscillatoriales cyanobacterium]
MENYKIGDVVVWDCAVGTVKGKIKDCFNTGLIPGIKTEVKCSKQNPGYLIELSDKNGILIGKNASDLHLEISPTTVQNLGLPKLTEKQILKLNQFIPTSFPNPNPQDLTVLDFVVADNLVNRGRSKWREKDLIILAKMLNTMGIPHTLDHDWETLSKTQGLVIAGEILKNEKAPDNLISAAGNKKLNSEIVNKEGFVQVIATVAFPIDSPIVQRLSMGIGRAVSLGGFAFEDYVCPICETSFTYKNCPHYIPEGWDAWGEDPSLVAPYYIRDGLYDLGELSSVLIANLPGATAVVGNGV